MSQRMSQALHVSVDTGCYHHHAAVGLSNGDYLGSFEFPHNKSGFADFFAKIERYKKHSDGEVCVAMEGYNGHARPLDRMIQLRDYRLFNINNVKLSRFKEIFPGAAKTDPIDARKGLELFQLQQTLPLAKNVLQEVAPVAEVEHAICTNHKHRPQTVDEWRTMLSDPNLSTATQWRYAENSFKKKSANKREEKKKTHWKDYLVFASLIIALAALTYTYLQNS